jgi:hypothetical protein
MINGAVPVAGREPPLRSQPVIMAHLVVSGLDRERSGSLMINGSGRAAARERPLRSQLLIMRRLGATRRPAARVDHARNWTWTESEPDRPMISGLEPVAAPEPRLRSQPVIMPRLAASGLDRERT